MIIGEEGYEWEYQGEMDAQNRACGRGTARRSDAGGRFLYEGTFDADKFHGVGK